MGFISLGRRLTAEGEGRIWRFVGVQVNHVSGIEVDYKRTNTHKHKHVGNAVVSYLILNGLDYEFVHEFRLFTGLVISTYMRIVMKKIK